MRHLTIIFLFLFLISCSSSSPAAEVSPSIQVSPTQSPGEITPAIASPAPQASPTSDLGGLTENESATLRSLQKVDGYPFYVMHYAGGYAYPETTTILLSPDDFSCSLFAAMGTPSAMVYGRNFDWEYSPALLLFTNPPDGYASVSMVDLTFLGIPPDAANSLTSLVANYQDALLTTPMLPFDGMNEYGLAIGMAAVPDEYTDDATDDPSLPNIGSIGIIRQVLDHARNAEEAVAMFEQYNIMFSGGPPIHYLVADRSGKAALIEFYEGEMVVLPNQDAWHLATNHLRCIARGDGGCSRYHTLAEALSASGGQLDLATAMQLLSTVDQEITQWSAVYNMSSGDIGIVIGRAYDQIFSFHLDLLKP